METTAIYLRSSKDRADVSIDAQRRELQALAQTRQLAIVEEFTDAVESGKDDQRPGFQALLRRLKDKGRSWTFLLALDTSRIARNQYLAHALHYECDKRGIKILYSKVPETNTVMDVVLRAVLQSFDELHSLMSREKGLAGMTENVKQGWRAGGRAPLGYRLESTATGAMRDGAEVAKSKLAPSSDAERVGRYLKARAAGIARGNAAAEAGLAKVISSTLVGMEWNALTYAGHTVWNVHNERIPGGGYRGGAKRRPRSEWVIQYDTHPALIGTEEAETLLAKLDKGRPNTYRTKADTLLGGLLTAPDGRVWHGDGEGCYRLGKGRRIGQREIEEAVMAQLIEDLGSDKFAEDLAKEARAMTAPPPDSELKPLRAEVSALTAKIGRATTLAIESDVPRPFMEQIKLLETKRETLTMQLEDREAAQRAAEVMRAISATDARKLMGALAERLQEIGREDAKELLGGLLARIELCPESFRCQMHYRISTGDLVASPRQSQQIPALQVVRALALRRA